MLPKTKVFLAVLVLSGGIVYKDKLQLIYNEVSNILWNALFPPVNIVVKGTEGVFSQSLLSEYDGIKRRKMYLAVLGTVFDVTKGRKHYAKESSYHYFVGKDGSRALVTGNFRDESKNKDHVLDLSCNDLFALVNWRNTFKEKYIFVGILQGRYYDEYGNETEYSVELKNRLEKCDEQKEIAKKQEINYPPCNIAWTAGEGSKVWCTKTSGGVVRDWVGVPRQLYTPGESIPKCVCVKDNDINVGMLKKYENCSSTSISCIVNSD